MRQSDIPANKRGYWGWCTTAAALQQCMSAAAVAHVQRQRLALVAAIYGAEHWRD